MQFKFLLFHAILPSFRFWPLNTPNLRGKEKHKESHLSVADEPCSPRQPQSFVLHQVEDIIYILNGKRKVDKSQRMRLK